MIFFFKKFGTKFKQDLMVDCTENQMFGRLQKKDYTSNQRGSNRGRTNHPMSPAALKFVKFGALVMLLCSVHCTAGRYTVRDARNKNKKISSCSSYGHSCWGAHGKRSDNSANDNVAVSLLPEDAQNYLLLARLFRGATTGGQGSIINTGSQSNQDSIIKEQLMANGAEARHWNDDAWNAKEGGKLGGGEVRDGETRGNDEIVRNGEIGNNNNADENNFGFMENYLTENGKPYLTRHPLSPIDQLNFRYLLRQHLSKYN